jgi:hypothetical protein
MAFAATPATACRSVQAKPHTGIGTHINAMLVPRIGTCCYIIQDPHLTRVTGDSRAAADNDAPHTSQCDKMITWGNFLPELRVPARRSGVAFFCSVWNFDLII